jgi:arylsulfatase A-like enzyme
MLQSVALALMLCLQDRLPELAQPQGRIANPNEPRHVVVITLDDVGVDKIGAYGEHPTAGPTPTLDMLAANGLLFRNAYANPTCSPTRACMLTGLYGSRTGVDTGMPHYDPWNNPNGDFAPSDELPWLPWLLEHDGVSARAVGKWHLTHVDVPAFQQHPIRVGFRSYDGHLSNIIDGQTYYSWDRTYADIRGYAEWTASTYVTVAEGAEGLGALLDDSDEERSFLWLAFNAPHPDWDDLPPAGTFTPVGQPITEPKKQQRTLQSLDTYLGQVMAAYASYRPVAFAETLWIIVGDNGTPGLAVEAPWPNHQHKAEVYQGGVRVPMIAFGAGVQPGETEDLVHAVDLWSTVLEILDVAPPEIPTDSRSFAGVLAGGRGTRETVYVRHAQPNGFGVKDWREHAATDGHWKLIRRQGLTPAVQLFDLIEDPLEQNDLWPAETPEEGAAVILLDAVLDAGDDTIP